MDGWVNGWMDGWLGGWMDGQVNGWTDGWMMDRWMGGLTNKRLSKFCALKMHNLRVAM